MPFLYFETKYAVQVHDQIITNTGGFEGIKDEGHLCCILEHIRNDDYYPELEDKLTYLMYSINKSHVFFDGNKRSSIALCAYFLQINGFESLVPSVVFRLEDIAVWVADNKISRDLLREVFLLPFVRRRVFGRAFIETFKSSRCSRIDGTLR